MHARFVFTLLAVIAAGCGPSGESPPDAAETAVTEEAQIVAVTADVLKREIADLDADAVVLNVWATWCGPCRIEFPEFVRFGRDMADRNVAVRFLSVDEPDLRPQIEQFLTEHEVGGRTYLSAEGTEIVNALAAPNPWTYGIPVTFIFGPDGELRDYWEGVVNYDFLDAKVTRALAASSEA